MIKPAGRLGRCYGHGERLERLDALGRHRRPVPRQHTPQLVNLVQQRPEAGAAPRVGPLLERHAGRQRHGRVLGQLLLQLGLDRHQPPRVVLQPLHSRQAALHHRRGLAQQVELAAHVQVPALHGHAVLRGDAREVVQGDLLVVLHMDLERLRVNEEVDGDVLLLQPAPRALPVAQRLLLLVLEPPALEAQHVQRADGLVAVKRRLALAAAHHDLRGVARHEVVGHVDDEPAVGALRRLRAVREVVEVRLPALPMELHPAAALAVRQRLCPEALHQRQEGLVQGVPPRRHTRPVVVEVRVPVRVLQLLPRQQHRGHHRELSYGEQVRLPFLHLDAEVAPHHRHLLGGYLRLPASLRSWGRALLVRHGGAGARA
mmetsp:Transcript_18737/g.63814  ORF Transcript_18737/g.63814 Transcript_18737/m.63814 type:complete len:373 (-) Transcript_18737:61-1179(-)